jgi:hypothetical protein
MTRHASLFAASIAIAIAAVLAACLDVTPITVVPVEPDADVPPPPPPIDAGPDAPDVDPRTDCQKCIETPDMPGPGCGDELAICLGDPKCRDTYDCMIRRNCLARANQQLIILCGLPCAAEAGIQSQFEQAANEIYDVATCAEGACPKPCHVGDAGAD